MGLGKIYVCICYLFLAACNTKGPNKPLRIAFLADVHLQNIHADFPTQGYPGVEHPNTGDFYNIRTMKAQSLSTRLFNENYFAFLAALDDLAEKDITYVVLPGDFSDDGQPINVSELKRILKIYEEKHGMQFFLTTGNHDPVRPFSIAGGKYDFLGQGGRKQTIVSDSSLINTTDKDLTPLITKQIVKWGYEEIVGELGNFGFYPKKEYLYWETPFSSYVYEDYDFDQASDEAILTHRTYTMENTSAMIPDMSYMVEPVKDLWLLAIDANVYVPKKNATGSHTFSGSSIGYDNVIRHKKHIISWSKKIAKEAKKRGKTLIAFSHYPMVEFNDGASGEMAALFGTNKMQLHRVPKALVSETFADAGIQIHFGGHMHLNDTGVFTSKSGNTLFNIQVPTLAAYMPAYKILTINTSKNLTVKTEVVGDVLGFDTFFPMYETELEHLKEKSKSPLWDAEILSAPNYKTFTKLHLKELVNSRFLSRDWPSGLKEKLLSSTGKELLLSVNPDAQALKKQLEAENLVLSDFEKWEGMDMIYDFYFFRSADGLAMDAIGNQRLKQYELLCEVLKNSKNKDLALWGTICQKTFHGSPSVNFKIDLNSGTISKLKNNLKSGV